MISGRLVTKDKKMQIMIEQWKATVLDRLQQNKKNELFILQDNSEHLNCIKE